MKAVVYDRPREVNVKDVPDARIERPTDALVKITDEHLRFGPARVRGSYRLRTPPDPRPREPRRAGRRRRHGRPAVRHLVWVQLPGDRCPGLRAPEYYVE